MLRVRSALPVLAAVAGLVVSGLASAGTTKTTTARSLPNGKTDVIKVMGNTRWIADVQRPADQYRGRYQTHLGQASHLLG
jgi:hypothetical protein